MKLINATQVMVTNLAGNLALVTCREPLRVHIRDNLENLLDSQTSLDAAYKETIKEISSQDNLDLACAIVKKFVIDKALDEVSKDHYIKEAIDKRKLARGRKRGTSKGRFHSTTTSSKIY
jgi:CCR4-NOT transcription complex subunit 1